MESVLIMSMFRTLISMSNGGGGLPSDYQSVTCLKITEATGSYIDLQLPVTWGHTIVMDLEPKLYSQNWTTIACSSMNSSSYRFYYNSEGSAPNASVGIRMNNPGTGVDGSTSKTSGLNEQRRTFTMVHKTTELSISVSDIPTLSYSKTPSSTPTNSGNWRLYSQGANSDRYRGKIYNTQIYDSSNNKIIDLVPCYRKADTVAGMYDLINNVFYTSLTTQPFEYEV